MSNPYDGDEFQDLPLSNTSNDSTQKSPQEEQTAAIVLPETSGPSNIPRLQGPGAATPTGRGTRGNAGNPESPADLQGSDGSQLTPVERLGFRRGTANTPPNTRGQLRSPFTPRNDWRPGQRVNSPWGPSPRRISAASYLTPPDSAGRGEQVEISGPATARPSTSGGELSTAPRFVLGGHFTARPRPPLVHYSPADQTLSFTPSGEPSVIPDPYSTEYLTDEPTFAAEPYSTDETTLTTEPSSNTEPTTISPSKIRTSIHPVSVGGSVTWKDHNDFVYTRGKDRGPRVPAPRLPPGYKTKGPLKNFDFDKLRQSRGKNAPVIKFRDEYESRQLDQTPTSLVTEIVSYYESNEDEHMAMLLDKASQNQTLSFTIRSQEIEIKKLKEDGRRAVAVKEEEIIQGLNETVKQRERTINILTRQINELKNGTYILQGNAEVEENITLMARIVDLEEQLKARSENSIDYEDKVNNLLIDVRNKEDTINNLIVTIKDLEERNRLESEANSAAVVPERSRLEAQLKNLSKSIKENQATIDHLTQRNHELEKDVRLQRENNSVPSQDTARAAPFQLLQEREASTNYILKYNAKLEEAERVRQEVRGTPLLRMPNIKEMIKTSQEIQTVALESQARVILLRARNYLEDKQYPASGKEVQRAKDIVRNKLPGLQVLKGKCMYMHGRALYEQGLVAEAVRELRNAELAGFDRDCGEVDGERITPLLLEARGALREAQRSGVYPEGASLGSDL